MSSDATSGAQRDLEMELREAKASLAFAEERREGLKARVDMLEELVQAMTTSEERLRRILDTHPGPIVEFDSLGAVLYVNPAFERVFGFLGDELRGKALDNVPADMAGQLEELLAAMAEGKVLTEVESRRENSFGMELDVILDMVPVHDGKGRFVGRIEFLQDVTEKKMAEDTLKETQARYEILLEASPDPIAVFDLVGSLNYMNSAFCETFGLEQNTLGAEPPELVPSTHQRANQAMIERVMSGKKVVFETRRIDGQGRVRDILASMAPYVTSDGEIAGRMEILRDITEAKSAERRIRQAEQTYRTIFENAMEGIYQALPDGTFIKANRALASMLGFVTAEELIRSVGGLGVSLFADRRDLDAFLHGLRTDGCVDGLDTQLLKSNGEVIWGSMSARAIMDDEGNIQRFDGLVRDVTERKRKEMEMRRKATRDELTGLPNRFLFRHSLDKMLAQASRAEVMFSLLYLDLDWFKEVNDTHGHHVGDMLLKAVAERLQSRLRETDVAARVGGDEFVLLLWNIKSPEDVGIYARKLIKSMGEPFPFDVKGGIECRIGASVGGAVYPVHGTTAEELLKRSDEAMYTVKKKGKNEFHMAGT